MIVAKPLFTAKRMYLLAITLAAMVISLSVYLFYQGNLLLVRKSPMIEAAEEIKVNGSLAHLWFEEVLSGDTTQSIQEVWYYLDLADWYALALLEGGKSIKGNFEPITDRNLRKTIISMRETISEFREYDRLRYRNSAESSPGSEIDIITDKMFLNFILQADEVKREIKTHLNKGITEYQYISVTLIIAAIIIALYINGHLYRIEANRHKLVKSLEKANVAIESKNRQLHKQAHFDALTELPNRTLFVDRLEKTILNSNRLNLAFSVLFIDLDHFKAVNDEYGHDIGDKLLYEVARRVERCIRVSDTAARISGDEFVVVLENQKTVASSIHAANKIAANLLEQLDQPFQIGDLSLHISGSIGVSVYPTDGNNKESLIRYADNAMYHAKAQGKNNVQFYSDELNQISITQLETEHDLKKAISEDQFILNYLPKWDLRTGRILGLEALVRWKHPTRGLLYPDSFIPIAESSSLISSLDLLVARNAIKQKLDWLRCGVDTGQMCINISARSLKKRTFFAQLKQLILNFRLPPGSLELEITETVLVDNVEHARSMFQELQSLGVRIALDDFGTGYSSLSYLKNFQFDSLKIDRSFLLEYNESTTSAALLKNIIQIGRDLEMNIVAEGVETHEQRDLLVHMGCSIGQGYMLTKPVDAPTLIRTLFNDTEVNIAMVS